MNGEDITDEKNDVFSNDALYMLSLIGKHVQITLVDNEVLNGIVYVIDPVFKHLVLHERASDLHFITKIVLYHSVKSLTILPDEKIESYIAGNEQKNTNINPDIMEHRKKQLKQYFQNMCLDVEESGDCLKIDDNLVIVPPYGPENCISNNTLVLERIQNMIISMPFIVSS